MNCQQAEQRLSAWIDGEVHARDAGDLEAHLQSCDACRATEQSWRDMGQQLRAIEVVGAQTPEAAWQDVQRALRLERDKPAPVPWLLPGVWKWAPVALLALLLGFGLYFGRPSDIEPIQVAQIAEVVEEVSGGVEYVETDLPGAASMVYVDDDTGMTVVWVVEMESEDDNGAG